jgi:cell division protein FtsB
MVRTNKERFAELEKDNRELKAEVARLKQQNKIEKVCFWG